MPSRYYQRNFIKGYYYHIYNRGANKSNVFLDDADYAVFIQILAYYLEFPFGMPLSILNNPNYKVRNLVKNNGFIKLCAYCLMPNHFHFIIKQAKDDLTINSISNLMRRLMVTYAMYFTKKYDRSGTLFQGKFKNILVDSDIQLSQLSKYVHLNPLELQGSEPLKEYKYSSYPSYIGLTDKPKWLDVQEILNLFSKTEARTDYERFVEDGVFPRLPEPIVLESGD